MRIKYLTRVFVISLILFSSIAFAQETNTIVQTPSDVISNLVRVISETISRLIEYLASASKLVRGCGYCQYLVNNTCVDHECCEDAVCDYNEQCINHTCHVLSCGYCQYVENHTCISYECCADSDCDDANPCTIDTCSGTPKACSHTPITSCINDDDCCPSGCYIDTDNDCMECQTGKILCEDVCTTPTCSLDTDCDDYNTCTIDVCNDAGACNASCSYTPITSCVNDDGCCPSGCVYINDTDCPSVCGDGNCSVDENECICPTDCGDCSGNCGTCREYKCIDSNCTCSVISNCCGNGICEASLGEDQNSCPDDCLHHNKSIEFEIISGPTTYDYFDSDWDPCPWLIEVEADWYTPQIFVVTNSIELKNVSDIVPSTFTDFGNYFLITFRRECGYRPSLTTVYDLSQSGDRVYSILYMYDGGKPATSYCSSSGAIKVRKSDLTQLGNLTFVFLCRNGGKITEIEHEII